MIKWYDWAVAFLAADFFVANVVIAVSGPIWYIQMLGVVGAYFVLDLWTNSYCTFRLRRQQNK